MKLLGLVLSALVTVGCACKGSSPGAGTGRGTGTGSGTGGGGDPAACAAIEAHVTDLYRAAADRTSAERTKLADVEIADNVAMVLAECKEAPARVVPCVQRATAVTQLENQCLAPLDDEGSEGERFRP